MLVQQILTSKPATGVVTLPPSATLNEAASLSFTSGQLRGTSFFKNTLNIEPTAVKLAGNPAFFAALAMPSARRWVRLASEA